MKKPVFYTVICCLFSLCLAAQHHSISGKVLFLNSGKTPVAGVQISGSITVSDSITLTANAVYSASDGSYILTFPEAAPGHLVELTVGDTDGNEHPIELVNEEELRIWRIPKDPKEAFNIIVCKKGERDVTAQRYYEILKTSADRELEKMKKQWSALVDQNEKDYRKITEMSARINKLEKQADSLEIYKAAYRMASINRDNASRRVKRYLKRLDEGKSVQEAREALSIGKATIELEKNTKKFTAGVEELETRARASTSIFDYKDAIACYDTIISYSQSLGIDRLKMAHYYGIIARINYADGDYATVLEYQKSVMSIYEATLNSRHPDVASIYNSIGRTYRALGKYKVAMEYHQKAIAIREAILSPKNLDLAAAYNNIGLTHQHMGDYKKALKYLQQVIAIEEDVLEPGAPALSTAYNNIGNIYHLTGQYNKALKYHQQSIAILENIGDSQGLELISAYNNIALTYQALGQHKKAVEYHQRAIKFREDKLDPNHPDLATVYINIAIPYNDLGQYENAMQCLQKAMAILEAVLEPKHPDLASVYSNIGAIYEAMKQYDAALKYQHKAIAIREEVLGPDHSFLAVAYNNIAFTYKALGQYDTTLEYQKKSIAIREKVLDPMSPSLGVAYINIAATYEEMKEFQKALGFQEKCLAIFSAALPENHPYRKVALIRIAGTYYKSNKYPKAIKMYESAVASFPDMKEKDFYSNIGLAYAKNKQFKEAYEAFSEYEKRFPDKGITYRNWAVYYALQNDREKALCHLQKAVELGYTNLEWLNTDDSMDSLRTEKIFTAIIAQLKRSVAKE